METASSKVNYQYLIRISPIGRFTIIDGSRDAIFKLVYFDQFLNAGSNLGLYWLLINESLS